MTVKQKQCLLCYMGTLAPEDIDGLWGGVSAAAGACLSIYAMQALCRPGRNGTGNFCFYNWGLALLCIVLFLLV